MARKLTVLSNRTWNTTKNRTDGVRFFKLIDTTSSDGDGKGRGCRQLWYKRATDVP
jgi:hypothetical protein